MSTWGKPAGPMTFDISVRVPRRRDQGVDLRVSAPEGTVLADVLPTIAEAAGVSAGEVRATCRGVEVAPGSVLGVAPLVHGATLVLDEQPTGVASPDATPGAGSGRLPAAGSSPMDLVVVAGPDAGRRVPIGRDGVVIGRSAGLGLSLGDPRLSRRHARITPGDNGFRVQDLGSTNGVRCGDRVIHAGEEADVDPRDAIVVGGSALRLVRSASTSAATLERGDGRIAVNRSPHTRPPRAAVTVTAPTPPVETKAGRIPWVAAALPLPFAGLLAVFFGPQMLAFALLSPLMVVGNVLGDRWGRRRDHARECERHAQELAERTAEFEGLRALEREQRWLEAPDPAAVLDIAAGPGTRLWERRSNSPDLGRVRLGIGDLPSRVGWTAPGTDTDHPTLADVPVVVDLGDVRGLGVAGPRDEVDGTLRHVVGQLSTLHSPRHLRLIVRAGEGEVRDEVDPGLKGAHLRSRSGAPSGLSWARWLPHTTAYGGVETCLEALREVVASREAARERGESVTLPVVVVVLPDAAADLGSSELTELLDRGRDLGVGCVVGARHAGELPRACHAVVGLGQGVVDGTARLDVDAAQPIPSFRADHVGWWWGERLGRSLAPLVDASGHGDALPESLHLVDLFPELTGTDTGAGALADRAAGRLSSLWSTGDGRPLARVGRLAGDDWVIDLAADGPHVLVGGTTGSGKSEFLRTLVASLATSCSPADLTFVLVDYKGGSAFGECAELPHTVGLVTNLDDGLARRALVSLTAEIERREALLASSGARDFDDHRRRAGGLARLVIVIDEFRLLADELPDFVDGVVSLAAVGRSLGVHLVLATQRPAGAITADIQANVNLRIAMRMRDTADSTDVIAAPDAASLPPSRPGRGYARGGDGALVAFQAARVGADRSEQAATVARLDAHGTVLHVVTARSAGSGTASDALLRTESPTPGGADQLGRLASLVAAAREGWQRTGLPEPHRPWLPPLPERLMVGDVPPAAVGVLDSPERQRQTSFTHEGTGHWVLAGGPRSGRTAALRTILASHAQRAEAAGAVYVIDTSGELTELERLPLVGAVVGADDTMRVRRLLGRLRAACATPTPGHPPALLLIDGWERLESDHELGVGGLRDELLDLLRASGPALRAVVTGDRSVLSSRLTALAEQTFLLPLADPADATYAGLSRRDLPSSRAPGRALRLADRVEVQFALRDPAAEVTADMTAPAGLLTIPFLPESVELDDLDDLDPWPGPGAQSSPTAGAGADTPMVAGDSHPNVLEFGVCGETGGRAQWDLDRHGRRILVLGHGRSGRTTALASLGRCLMAHTRVVAVVERRGGALADMMEAAGLDATAPHGRPGVIRVDPWVAQPLIDAKHEHPGLVVLVDDADALDGTPVEPVLDEIVGLVERDAGVVVASAAPNALGSRFRGALHSVARTQSGLLLSPRSPGDGEAFGLRAPRGVRPLPGRGLLVTGRQGTEVQVARPGTRARTAA